MFLRGLYLIIYQYVLKYISTKYAMFLHKFTWEDFIEKIDENSK